MTAISEELGDIYAAHTGNQSLPSGIRIVLDSVRAFRHIVCTAKKSSASEEAPFESILPKPIPQ